MLMNSNRLCSICSKPIDVQHFKNVAWTKGHNASPVTDGRCCTDCNLEKVIPARINQIVGDRSVKQHSHK